MGLRGRGVTERFPEFFSTDLCGQIWPRGMTSSCGQTSVAAPFVVVSQSRRLSAGQDTIPAPPHRNTPDGLLALHFVPRTASPLRTGASWRPGRGGGTAPVHTLKGTLKGPRL